MAVAGDNQPHFTPLAAFISELDEAVARLFAQVLVVGDRQGLIGRERFAIDGVKLPSTARKAKSGTQADFRRQAEKLEQAAKRMLERHGDADTAPTDERQARLAAKKLERRQKEAKQ